MQTQTILMMPENIQTKKQNQATLKHTQEAIEKLLQEIKNAITEIEESFQEVFDSQQPTDSKYTEASLSVRGISKEHETFKKKLNELSNKANQNGKILIDQARETIENEIKLKIINILTQALTLKLNEDATEIEKEQKQDLELELAYCSGSDS